MSHSLLPRLLLIVALLFAQMGSVTHVISHVRGDLWGDQTAKHAPDQTQTKDKHCDLCEVYAQIGSAVGAASLPMLTADNLEASHLIPRIAPTGNAHITYPARAPPRSA